MKYLPVFRAKCIITIFVLFFCVFASAQKTFTPEQFDQKISDCNSLAEQNPEEAVLCFNKLLPLLEQADYKKGIINYYAYVSYIYTSQGKIQEAVDLVYEGKEKHFDKLVDENMRMFFVMLEIRVLEEQEKYLEVLSLIEKIMPEVTINQQKAYLYTTRGVNYQRLGEYEKALSDQYEALKLYKSIQETENVITIYNRLGLLNKELQDPQKELSFYEKALKLAQDIKSETSLQVVYNNLATFYKQTDSLNKALEYYEKSRELAKKYNSPIDLATILFNIGDVYAETGKTRQAVDNFNQSLAISKEFGVPQGIMYNYLGLGKVYTKTGEYSISKTNYDSLMVYAKRFERPNMEVAAHYGLYKMYEAKKDYEKSLYYYIKSDSISKVIFGEEKQKAIAELEVKYETEFKDIEIEKMHFAFESKQAQNRLLLVGIILVVFIAGFVVFFLIYRNKSLRELYNRNMELLNTVNFYKVTPEKTDDRDQLKKIFDKLLDLLNNEKIFKDPNLGIKDVAEMIKMNERYVSSAVSAYAKMNYSNFINFYRINEAKELINEMEFANLNEIMYACGFNSRTTFYNAFKNFTGLSPKQFKEMKKESATVIEE